jgi:hypothetical protein
MKPTFCLFALAASLCMVPCAHAAVDQGLLALVPESTVLLTGIDADVTRSSDFGQFLLRRMNNEDDHFRKFVEDTGFDPRRDLQSFLFAGFGAHQGHGVSKFAILARGVFDSNRILGAVKARSVVSTQSYAGVPIFIDRQPGNDNAFAFPEVGVAVMGDLGTVKEVLNHRATPSVLDPALLQRVNDVSAANDVWFASLLSGSFFGNRIDLPGGGSQLKDSSALQSVLQSSGGVHFGDQVKLSLDATTRSPEDAISLTDVIRFVSSMVQTQRRNSPSAALIAPALDHMELRATGADVHVGLSLSEKSLELLAQSSSKDAR